MYVFLFFYPNTNLKYFFYFDILIKRFSSLTLFMQIIVFLYKNHKIFFYEDQNHHNYYISHDYRNSSEYDIVSVR